MDCVPELKLFDTSLGKYVLSVKGVSKYRVEFYTAYFDAVLLRIQEKLEHCLFKLRIAARKGREVKVAKIHKKIDRLRKQLAGETLGSDEGDEVCTSIFA